MLDFHELYDNYAKDVFHFSLWMTGDKFEAEDITSETLIRAWGKREKIRTETLKAYLFTISRNLYLGKKRGDKRQVDLDETTPDPSPSPEMAADSNHRIQAVRKFLKTVPEIDRAAFVMRVQHQIPYAEIARALEISTSAAKVKVHRVRKKLLINFLEKEVV